MGQQNKNKTYKSKEPKRVYQPSRYRPKNIGQHHKMTANNCYFIGNAGLSFLHGDNATWKAGWNVNGGVGLKTNIRGYEDILAFELILGYTGLNGGYPHLEIELSNAITTSVNVNFNFMQFWEFRNKIVDNINVEPYVGIGIYQYKTHIIYYNGTHVLIGHDNAAPNNSHGHGIHGRKCALTIPFGIDFNYKIHPQFRLHLDVGACPVLADDLDGVISGINKDWNSNISFGISYSLDKN